MARLRFSVSRRSQTALFRKVRFFSPAQTPARLTQKRTLSRHPHVKAHSDQEVVFAWNMTLLWEQGGCIGEGTEVVRWLS